jgi:hypothetical protein
MQYGEVGHTVPVEIRERVVVAEAERTSHLIVGG